VVVNGVHNASTTAGGCLVAGFDGDFAEFYSARFDTARRTAFALCGDWVEAEEIAQAGFVRLYAKWPRVAKGSTDAYLRTVITRLFLDTRRRGRARERLVAEPPERSGPADTAQVDERQSLLAALQRVSPRQRATLVLRIVHDLSVEQVAETLRCSTGTVKSQLARGMHALREAYHGAETAERSVRDAG
jgi:RNA polymerase sigma-70 factor (sigma-E family)